MHHATPTETARLADEVTINRVAYGAMRLTGPGVWGPPADRANAIAVLRRVVEAGVNLIDTADAYGPEDNESLIAEALHPYPDDLVIATKAGLVRSGPGQWASNAHPDHLRATIDGSLQRLRLERIDLLQLHRIDPAVPLADTLGTLTELQAEGKIRFLGLSEVSVEDLDAAQDHAEIVSVQNRYNATDRQWDDVVDTTAQRGQVFFPWSPIAAGTIAASALDTVAARHDTSAQVIALAWLLHRSPNIVIIPGSADLDHVEDNLTAGDIDLTADDLELLDQTS